MFDLDGMKDTLPEWAQEYFRRYDEIKAKLPEGWNLYGEKKDEQTPRFMMWRGPIDTTEVREFSE